MAKIQCCRCGTIAEPSSDITHGVCCQWCGSQDTRLLRKEVRRKENQVLGDSESIEPGDHQETEEPVCPHCGQVVKDVWDLAMKNDHCDGYQCEECEHTFDIYRHVSVTYTTYKS